MVWFAPRRLPGRPSSPKGRSAIAARRPAATLDPGASATLTVPRTGQAGGPARHDAPREPHHHSERSDTTSSHLSSHRLTYEIASWISMLPTLSTTTPPPTTTSGGPSALTGRRS